MKYKFCKCKKDKNGVVVRLCKKCYNRAKYLKEKDKVLAKNRLASKIRSRELKIVKSMPVDDLLRRVGYFE